MVLLSDYFELTLDQLVKDVDVGEVRKKNLDPQKLDSIYQDMGKAKKIFRWYLIVAGGAAAIVLLLIISFAIHAVYIW